MLGHKGAEEGILSRLGEMLVVAFRGEWTGVELRPVDLQAVDISFTYEHEMAWKKNKKELT